MINRLRQFFAPPTFLDEEKNRVARLLHTILYSLIVLLVVVNLVLIPISLLANLKLPDLMVSVVSIAVFVGLLALTRLGFVNQVSLGLSFVVSAVVSYTLFRSGNLLTMSASGYVIAIIIAGLLSGGWSAVTIAVFNLLSLAGLNYLAARSTLPTAQPLAGNDFVTLSSIFILCAVLLGLAWRSIRDALDKARQNELAQIKANEELMQMHSTLEQRVADRTKALSTSMEISRRISTLLDRQQLATEVVNQINHAFSFYHTQIYFYDSATDNLVMASGTGDAGKKMLAQFHKVKRGRGLVGRAAASNESVLVANTMKNPEWLPNPLLPETRAEIAVPISIGETVLGVLDVQHNSVDGLHPEDVESLQSIASQVAVALQNIQQYETTHKIASDMGVVATVGIATSTITETDRLLQEVVDLSKQSFGLYHVHIYLMNEAGTALELVAGAGEVGRQMAAEKRSIGLDSEQSLVARAARSGEGVVVNDVTASPDFLPNPLLPDTRAEMAVPMKIAGKVIGVLDVQSERIGRFTDVDISIKTTLASQIAIALQNARNLAQSKYQAEREMAVNTITQKIQNATNIEAALQIAARELGHALGMKPTLITLEPEALASKAQKSNEQTLAHTPETTGTGVLS